MPRCSPLVAVLDAAPFALRLRAQTPLPSAQPATRTIERRVVDLRGEGLPAARVFVRTWDPVARRSRSSWSPARPACTTSR
jgi:hypothetical protein